MKFSVIAVLLLCIFSSKVFASEFEAIATRNEQIKAVKCIVETGYEVKDSIKLVTDIVEENYAGAVLDVYHLTKRLFSMLKNCKTLFCFGPTFKKCNASHPQGCEKTGLIVYPKCAPGYTNWECCVCANVCPEGFTDNGLYCLKPRAYGRGAGYVLWKRSKCERSNPQGCEKWGLIWYPKCRTGFHNVGCCICSPNCPSGWTDIGISCKKPNTYGRGVGYPVSFGYQCVKEHAMEEAEKMRKQNCSEQKKSLELMKQQIAIQHEQAEQNQNNSNPQYPDNLKEFGEKINQYADQCMDQQQQ